jgi:uncharacterized protein YuzE
LFLYYGLLDIMKHRTLITVSTKRPPIVELDSSAHAAYVRFTKKRVAETKIVSEDRHIVTIDLDSSGDVIGVEIVGVAEFSASSLLKLAGIAVPKALLAETSYIPAQLQATA